MLGPLGSLLLLSAACLPAPSAAQHPYLQSQPPVDLYSGFNGYFNLAPPPPPPPPKRDAVRGEAGGAASAHLETLESDDDVELVAGAQPQQPQPQRPPQPQPLLPPGALYGRRVYVLQVLPGGYQHYQPVYLMGSAGAGASHAAPGAFGAGYPGVVLLEQAVQGPAAAHAQPHYGPLHAPPYAWLRAGPEGRAHAQEQQVRQGAQERAHEAHVAVAAERLADASANGGPDTAATVRATATQPAPTDKRTERNRAAT